MEIVLSSKNEIHGMQLYFILNLVRTLLPKQWRIQDFPQGGVDLVGGRVLPRRLRFENFVCQNERIWTLGGGRAPGTPPSRSANAKVLRQFSKSADLITSELFISMPDNTDLSNGLHRNEIGGRSCL